MLVLFFFFSFLYNCHVYALVYVVEAIEDLCTSGKTVLDAINNDTSWGGGRKKRSSRKQNETKLF